MQTNKEEIKHLKKALEKSEKSNTSKEKKILSLKAEIKQLRKDSKKGVNTITLNKEQESLLSSLFPNIDILKLL